MKSAILFLVTCLGLFAIKNDLEVTATTILDVPFLASIEQDGGFKCSGAIIDDRFVLTSQACTNNLNLNTSEVFVRVGTSKLGYRGSSLQVIGIYPDDQLGTDLSLVKIATHFEYSPYIMWSNFNNFNMSEGSTGNLSTWSDVRTKMSNIIMTTVTVINNNTCAELLEGIFTVNDTVACVMPTSSYSKSCKASLGAPFYHDEMVYGVVSFNPGCDDETLPLVITYTGGYGSYILSKMCGIENILA